MKVTFLGAASTVTGSKYLLETSNENYFLIDCGLFQGYKNLRELNWQKLPINPAKIKAIFLTHAHLDHSGFIPRFVKQGFTGKIYCTQSTFKLAKILLTDSAHIQEEDANYHNRKKISKHNPALPLYTQNEVKKCLKYFEPIEWNKIYTLEDIKFEFKSSGHVLGASSLLIKHKTKSILFSGDLGREFDLIMNPPSVDFSPDYVVMESTYGDRNHTDTSPLKELQKVIKKVKDRKSILLIPSFAFGRAQVMLYAISKIFDKNKTLKMPVFLNSPMATNITDLYMEYSREHKLSKEECSKCFNLPTYINSVEESKALNLRKGPAIIIAASGMLTGGRVLHHIISFGGNKNNVILFVGYQSPGTRGFNLVNGKREIKIFKNNINVQAEIVNLDMFSAHADQQGLIRWLHGLKKFPKKIILTHGDPQASDELRKAILNEISVPISVPTMNQTIVF